MSHLELAYGHRAVSIPYDENRFEVLTRARDVRPLSDAEINQRIDNAIDSPVLEDIISPGESVLIVVSDATRMTASASIVNLLVRRLVELGVAPYDLHIIFATGIHRHVTPTEKSELLTPFVVQRVKTLDHNADDPTQHIDLGVTQIGTPIEVNRALTEHSHVILTGGINFHYFAGFTGGRKSVCPGLASRGTIEATHRLAFDFDAGSGGGRRRAGVGLGRLDGNILHEECERVAAAVGLSFLINTVTDERGRATEVYAGDWREAHRRACAEYVDGHTIEINEKREVVIVSCGGAPHDINMIQAHKALETATHACAEGGTIIFVAECADGLGRADFLKWFDEPDAASLAARLHTEYEVNGQTAWALLTKTERFRVHLVSHLPEEDTRHMRFLPASSINEALQQIDSTATGYIMPHGARVLPIIR